MFASVFTRGQKIFLHIVAAMALAAAAWRIWTVVNHSEKLERSYPQKIEGYRKSQLESVKATLLGP
jgi:hypothetical protein